MMNLVVLSFRRYDYDFRRYLVESAATSGARAVHVQWAKRIVAVLPNGSVIASGKISDAIEPIVAAIKGIVGDDGGIVLNSLGCQCPQDICVLRMAFRRWLFVFDVFDELSYSATGAELAKFKLKEMVHRLNSDMTIALSPDLKRLYRNALHLDNASHVKRIDNPSVEENAIGIIASINPRFDFALVERCARSLSEYRIRIHGRVHHDDEGIKSSLRQLIGNCANVSFHGPYKSPELNDILSRYRIGLVPYFSDHPLTAFINPDKYYHYLSAGMEVLSPPLPQARRLASYIHEIGSDTDIRAVVKSAVLSPKNHCDRSREFSWDARWKTLCEMTATPVRQRQVIGLTWPTAILKAADLARRSEAIRALSRPTDDDHNE